MEKIKYICPKCSSINIQSKCRVTKEGYKIIYCNNCKKKYIINEKDYCKYKCPKCSSFNTKRRGFIVQKKLGKRQRIFCFDCKKVSLVNYILPERKRIRCFVCGGSNTVYHGYKQGKIKIFCKDCKRDSIFNYDNPRQISKNLKYKDLCFFIKGRDICQKSLCKYFLRSENKCNFKGNIKKKGYLDFNTSNGRLIYKRISNKSRRKKYYTFYNDKLIERMENYLLINRDKLITEKMLDSYLNISFTYWVKYHFKRFNLYKEYLAKKYKTIIICFDWKKQSKYIYNGKDKTKEYVK